MTVANVSVGLAGSVLNAPCHACAFFRTREEEHQILAPFIREGIERGDRILQLIDSERAEERRRLLATTGIDVETAEKTGQMDIRPWEDAYLRGGRFQQDSMLDLVNTMLSDSKDHGFPMTRAWANMEWALTELPGVEEFIEYEARVNAVINKYDFVVVCTYDLTKFSAPLVVDVLRTHPMVIIGSTIQINPFYVPAPQFLAEMHARNVVVNA